MIIFNILFLLFLLPIIYYFKGNININSKNLDFKTISMMIIIVFLAIISTIYHHKIIKNEEITTSPSLIYGLRIIGVFILGILALNEKLTIKKLIALFLVLSGLFIFSIE